MGFNVLHCYEYSMRCDECGTEEVLHTGDYIEDRDIFVHSSETAIKAAEFHRSKSKLLCDECFRNRKLH